MPLVPTRLMDSGGDKVSLHNCKKMRRNKDSGNQRPRHLKKTERLLGIPYARKICAHVYGHRPMARLDGSP